MTDTEMDSLYDFDKGRERALELRQAQEEEIRRQDFLFDCDKTIEFLAKVMDWLDEAEYDANGTVYEDKTRSIRDDIENLREAVKDMRREVKDL